jgi:hypothetical protein
MTATGSTGVFTFTGGTGADTITGGVGGDSLTGGGGADTIGGGAGADTIVGGVGADTLNGGDGIDTITGGTGNDIITGGAGADIINGSAGADTFTGGAGVDAYTQGQAESVVATALIDATTGAAHAGGVVLAAGDTITFGNGVDVYTDFTAGTGGDTINVQTAGAATSVLGVAHDALSGADDILFASGAFNSTTNVFTFAADGTGADTMIIDMEKTGARDDIDGSTEIFILQNVDSDDLVAANFI